MPVKEVKDGKVVVLEREGDKVEVYTYGATVTRWQVAGEDILFLSDKAVLDGSKAIRGGIPLVFPNFGAWECGPSHGFGRISTWTWDKDAAGAGDSEDGTTAVFVLEDNEQTRAMWNHKFRLEYTVTLRKAQLECNLKIHNTSDESFDFTTLLHTYVRVPSIKAVTISPLKGSLKLDQLADRASVVEDQEPLTIAQNVDSIYVAVPQSLVIDNVATSRAPTPDDHSTALTRRKLTLDKANLPDTVVWNPWVEKTKAMGDLDDSAYKQFVCVEAGHVAEKHTLAPGQHFHGGQTLTLEAYR
ncbi:hypothetical protein PTSG_07916 [Salpingoeca rosetta]|uniref:glucose-6-phosphate 1-epimerase n=1 Tax=Salpingoeca rosetta (strain ATCC 50818 / BSB-021) TaxID=946362 RepID=F2UGP7_SALR5|nr:uncharacterized protein PTSG_07916 [Salpingoeca rosetta]EGD75797.1 hypothetical protein PTSG_07916 [Salpingoeca rosetta]|eukprot:XP_004991718.1 hypothetical protein PTSG_07916 [Salpingoeca rosetta]